MQGHKTETLVTFLRLIQHWIAVRSVGMCVRLVQQAVFLCQGLSQCRVCVVRHVNVLSIAGEADIGKFFLNGKLSDTKFSVYTVDRCLYINKNSNSSAYLLDI